MPEIDDELLQRIPTDMLINELKRRLDSAMCFIANALNFPAKAPVAEVHEKTGELPAPVPVPEVVRFSKAKDAGLAVPERKTDADLPPGHFQTRELPMTSAMRDPEQRAAVERAVAAAYSSPEASEVRAELEAEGKPGLVAEIDRAMSLRGQSSMRAPGLAAIVAINKRNNGDAFVQPILPPSIAGAVQVPTVTELGWFDDPAVVTVSLEDIVTSKAPQRVGIPTTSHVEIQQRVNDLAKTIKGMLTILKADGFTGHLPSPVIQVRDGELRLLLEPVVIWRLMVHLGPRLHYIHMEENLREALNAHILANVAEAERVLISAGPEMGARDFRDRVTSVLQTRFYAARKEDRGKIAQAIRRQIRILNPDMQEVAMPSERDAEAMGILDPRAVLGSEVKDGPGTVRDLAPLPSNVARLAALRKISGKSKD